MDAMDPISNNTNKFLTFKDIVLHCQHFWEYCLKQIKFIALISFICLLAFAYKTYHSSRIYEAELSFMVNEDNGSTNLSSLLGDFGGLLGSGNQLSLQKILELAKTMRISKEVLFTHVEIDGELNSVANHYIRELKENGLWVSSRFFGKVSPLESFTFPKNVHPDSLDRTQNEALKILFEIYQSNLRSQSNEKTGIMKIIFRSPNEDLSYHITNILFDRMGNFYIGKTIEKQQDTYTHLKFKVDSIKNLIEHKDYGLANIKDSYRSAWLYKEEVPKTIIDRDIKMLSIVYGEAIKNMEIASFSLENKTPFIQAIDRPVMPLKIIEEKYFKNILFGILTGLCVSILLLFFKYYYKLQMAV